MRLLMFGVVLLTLSSQAHAACGSAPPTDAQTWGFTQETFCDQTFGRVDKTDTLGTNFDWYSHGWVGDNPTPAGDISVASNQLTISHAGTQAANTAVRVSSRGQTVAYSTTSVGRVPPFRAGGYYEGCYAFDPATSTGSNTAWPTFWMQAINGLAHQDILGVNSVADQFVEFDIGEMVPLGAGTVHHQFNVHDWTTTNGSGLGTHNTVSSDVSSATLGSPTFNNATQHCYGMLWVLSTQNSGTGLIKFYFDGTHIASADVSYTSSGATPAATPSNPNGIFIEAETQTFVILLEGGQGTSGWPTIHSRVQVFQAPNVVPATGCCSASNENDMPRFADVRR